MSTFYHITGLKVNRTGVRHWPEKRRTYSHPLGWRWNAPYFEFISIQFFSEIIQRRPATRLKIPTAANQTWTFYLLKEMGRKSRAATRLTTQRVAYLSYLNQHHVDNCLAKHAIYWFCRGVTSDSNCLASSSGIDFITVGNQPSWLIVQVIGSLIFRRSNVYRTSLFSSF